jgi:hypothetical protein
VRGPGDGFFACGFRQLDRALPVVTRNVRRTNEGVEKHESPVHAREKRRIAHALGDGQRVVHLTGGVIGAPDRLEAAPSGESQLGRDRFVGRAVDCGEAGVEVGERFVVAAAPITGESHPALDARDPHRLAPLHRLAPSALPERHCRVVLAEPLARLSEILHEPPWVDVGSHVTCAP